MKNGLTNDEINSIENTVKKMEDLGIIPRINGTDVLLTPGQYNSIFNPRELTPLERQVLLETYEQSLKDKPTRPRK